MQDFDTDQLLGFRDRYSRRERDEEAISLAFLYESAAVYKYRAARGQVNKQTNKTSNDNIAGNGRA